MGGQGVRYLSQLVQSLRTGSRLCVVDVCSPRRRIVDPLRAVKEQSEVVLNMLRIVSRVRLRDYVPDLPPRDRRDPRARVAVEVVTNWCPAPVSGTTRSLRPGHILGQPVGIRERVGSGRWDQASTPLVRVGGSRMGINPCWQSRRGPLLVEQEVNRVNHRRGVLPSSC